MRSRWLAFIALVLGCSADEPKAPARDAAPIAVVATVDAAADDTSMAMEPPLAPWSPPPSTAPRPRAPELEVLLRSTPAGAMAFVDGKEIGATPVLWRSRHGDAAREFTFQLPGYSEARYRFIPTQNGIVHATLKRLISKGSSGQ